MDSDLHLTSDEAALVENSSWLLTKQRIVSKVYGLFGSLSEQYSAILNEYHSLIPAEVVRASPKIYRGEMYRQLPYVMLDQPRFFQHNEAFAIRSLFWWGNEFSIHLVLGGKYRDKYHSAILDEIQSGGLEGWFIGVAEDPWQHHFGSDNYTPVRRSITALSPDLPYTKLARRHPLSEWEQADHFFRLSYAQILKTIFS